MDEAHVSNNHELFIQHGKRFRNSMIGLGTGTLVASGVFIAEAITDLRPEVPTAFAAFMGTGLSLFGVAKIGYAVRVHQAVDAELPQSGESHES